MNELKDVFSLERMISEAKEHVNLVFLRQVDLNNPIVAAQLAADYKDAKDTLYALERAKIARDNREPGT